jgi:hypothetical protein
MLDVYVPNLSSMESFHGVLAGNAHEYPLKSRIGKARELNLRAYKGCFQGTGL